MKHALVLLRRTRHEISSVIIEGIQGVGGINVASDYFYKPSDGCYDEYGAVCIADSVQCKGIWP